MIADLIVCSPFVFFLFAIMMYDKLEEKDRSLIMGGSRFLLRVLRGLILKGKTLGSPSYLKSFSGCVSLVSLEDDTQCMRTAHCPVITLDSARMTILVHPTISFFLFIVLCIVSFRFWFFRGSPSNQYQNSTYKLIYHSISNKI